MLILTIRTDKPEAEVGLYEDAQQIGYDTWQAYRQLSVTIHTRIDEILKKHDKSLQDIQGIVCFQGPGSFTGLRIGLTLANALASALKIPIVARKDPGWLERGTTDLMAGQSDHLALPDYGSPVHITQQRKQKMSATELLYMQDFEVETCDAVIVTVDQTEDGRTDVVLDQTCFYARGGGQDWDRGTISKGGATFTVDEVRLDEAGNVHHIGMVTSGSFAAGDRVHCQVDHERRAINTRLHSAGHVLDMAVDGLGLDWIAGKGQHYPDLSAIEYTGTFDPAKTEELRAQIEQRANELIAKGTENTLRFMPVDEMHTVCRHVPENIPRNKPGRVVMYGDFGIPCGGTHVRNIAEVGKVYATKLKEKKGIIRLSYAVAGINNNLL